MKSRRKTDSHSWRALAGIGEIANILNPKSFGPTGRSFGYLIFLDKFEKISSADVIAKNLKTISSAEFIDPDFIEKKFALLISLKKIPTVDFIEKNFSNPKPQNRPTGFFKPQTPIFTDRPVVPFFVSYWVTRILFFSINLLREYEKKPQV